jgi:Bacterial Ig-like domain
MKTILPLLLLAGCAKNGVGSTDSDRPYVVSTTPESGSIGVDPNLNAIIVEFNEPMQPQSWSWVTMDPKSFPETQGDPTYTSATRAKLPVKLEAGRDYVVAVNSEPKFLNFKDAAGNPTVPFVLTFTTSSPPTQ